MKRKFFGENIVSDAGKCINISFNNDITKNVLI